MKSLTVCTVGLGVIAVGLLPLTVSIALAAGDGANTPVLAAKKEMVRKQQEQRITHEKRKAAAGALKAERMKVHMARQKAKQSSAETTEKK